MIYGVKLFFAYLMLLSTSTNEVSPSKIIKSFDVPNQIKFEVVNGLMILKVPNSDGFENFLFDTGSEQLIFNDLVATSTSKVVSVESVLDVNDIIIDQVTIGTKELNRVPAWGLDLRFLSDQLGIEIKGIIGSQLFDNYSVMIDYDENILKLVDHSSGLVSLASNYKVASIDFSQDKSDLPIIEVLVADKVLKLGLDTGANICVFDQKKHDFISSSSANTFELNSLKINKAKITKVPYLFRDFEEVNKSRQTKIDGLISAEALAANKIFIDSNKRKIYLFWEKSHL